MSQFLTVPCSARTAKTFSTITENQVEQATDSLKTNPEHDRLMGMFRDKVKGLLQNLYHESQQDLHFKVGSFPVAEFFRRMDRFELLEGTLDTPIQADPERESDFYLLGKNIALINKQALNSSNRSLTALCLHVMLGSMGFQDQDYQITLSLLISELSYGPVEFDSFKKVDFSKILPKEEKEYTAIKPIPLNPKLNHGVYVVAGGGGATGVGGGGDSTSLEMKLMLLEYLPIRLKLFAPKTCGGHWYTESDFVKSILYAKIESSPDVVDVTYGNVASGKTKIVIPQYQTKKQGIPEQVVISVLARVCAIEESGL